MNTRSDTWTNAQAAVRLAERVLFIGFGYHAENLQKILPKQEPYFKAGPVVGTSYGMTNAERKAISQKYAIDIDEDGMLPLEFLRNNDPLD
jgi:hypothetical protein